MEEEDLRFAGLFWLPPDPEDDSDIVPPPSERPWVLPIEACAVCYRVSRHIGRHKPPEGSQVDPYPIAQLGYLEIQH